MSRSRRRPGTRAAPPARPKPSRVEGVDALRGVALCLMFVYHAAFDLRWFHVINADFEHDSSWLGFRALILATFLCLVGVSLVLARQANVTLPRFLRRIGAVALGAIAVSAVSVIVFPRSYIFFGVLHCIVVSSLLARGFTRLPVISLVVGAAIIALGLGFQDSLFDPPWLSWLGFRTAKPPTEDYVPLAPWAGFVFIGIAAGGILAERSFRALAPLAAAPRWLRWLGRHSLVVYLLHQPILFTLVWMMVGNLPSNDLNLGRAPAATRAVALATPCDSRYHCRPEGA